MSKKFHMPVNFSQDKYKQLPSDYNHTSRTNYDVNNPNNSYTTCKTDYGIKQPSTYTTVAVDQPQLPGLSSNYRVKEIIQYPMQRGPTQEKIINKTELQYQRFLSPKKPHAQSIHQSTHQERESLTSQEQNIKQTEIQIKILIPPSKQHTPQQSVIPVISTDRVSLIESYVIPTQRLSSPGKIQILQSVQAVPLSPFKKVIHKKTGSGIQTGNESPIIYHRKEFSQHAAGNQILNQKLPITPNKDRVVYVDDPKNKELITNLQKRLQQLMEENEYLQNYQSTMEKLSKNEDINRINELENMIQLQQSEIEYLNQKLKTNNIEILQSRILNQDQNQQNNNQQLEFWKNRCLLVEKEKSKNEEFIQMLQNQIELLQSQGNRSKIEVLQLQDQLLKKQEETTEFNYQKTHQKIQENEDQNKIIHDLQYQNDILLEKMKIQEEARVEMEIDYNNEIEQFRQDKDENIPYNPNNRKRIIVFQNNYHKLQQEVNKLLYLNNEQEEQLKQFMYKQISSSYQEDGTQNLLLQIVLLQARIQSLQEQYQYQKGETELLKKNRSQTNNNSTRSSQYQQHSLSKYDIQ